MATGNNDIGYPVYSEIYKSVYFFNGLDMITCTLPVIYIEGN